MKTDYLYWHIKQIIPGEWGSSAPNTSSRKRVLCIRGTDIPNIAAGQIGDTPTRYVKDLSHALSHRDIVIEKSGGSSTQSTGRVAYISSAIANSDQPIVCSNFCAGLTFDNNVDHKYIYYHLLCLYKNNTFFNFETKTNGIHNLMLRQALSSIPTPSASIEYQRAVSTLLYRIDKTTTHSKRVLDLLARLISSIYDYWFVQFDFPDENGRPYKSSGGKMVYNDQLKQEIPEGWECKKLTDLFDFVRGTEVGADAYADKKISDSYIRFWRVRDVGDDCKTWIDGNANNLTIVKPGDVVITLDGTVGKIGIDLDGAISGGLRYTVDHTGVISNATIYTILQSDYVQESLKQYVSGRGSILAHASGALQHLAIPYDKNIFSKFQNTIQPMFDLMINCKEESKQLVSLRDWLLPMLMNGQVEIKE